MRVRTTSRRDAAIGPRYCVSADTVPDVNDDWRRTPGLGDYARPERERRFLVRRHPVSSEPGRHIEDRYLTGTRLRLRKVSVGDESVFKLGQKVRAQPDDPADVMLTNFYLDASEFERLSVLPATRISKTRRFCRVEGARFAVDQFHGDLAGLMLAEVEVRALADPLPSVDWLGAEVTHDDRYSGGSLAALERGQVASLLQSG